MTHDPGLELEGHLRLDAARSLIDAIEAGDWWPESFVLAAIAGLVGRADWFFERAGACPPELAA